MKPVYNKKITFDLINWDEVDEDECWGCPCYDCEEQRIRPYQCWDCDDYEDMCTQCPVQLSGIMNNKGG